MSGLELWTCWYRWPLVCLGTSECDCAQCDADDGESLAIYRRDEARDLDAPRPIRVVVIDRDAASATGWTATWLTAEAGRVVAETSTSVIPECVGTAIEDCCVQRRWGRRA